MKVIGLPLVVFIIASCSMFKKVKVENVDRIFLDYDNNQPINYSTTFEGKVFLEMKTGEQIELPNEKGFKTSENIDIRNNKEKISIVALPTAFDQEKLPITLTISDKDGMEVTSTDTIYINFKAPLSPYFSSQSGVSGSNGKNGSGKDKRGDGNFGEHGDNGTNGLAANNFDIWVWRVDSMYYFHVFDRNTLQVMRYQVFGKQKFDFYATGGHGGNGGNGADGRDGTVSGSTSVQPGNGGNGGDGGHAGNGGNGGSVSIYIHPSAADIQNFISVKNYGGSAGEPGKAGVGGKGGTSAAGQGLSRPGYNGRKGNFGMNGLNGTLIIVVQEFDPTTKK